MNKIISDEIYTAVKKAMKKHSEKSLGALPTSQNAGVSTQFVQDIKVALHLKADKQDVERVYEIKSNK